MFTLHAPDFDLRHTLESGQTFRWRRQGDGYAGVVGGALVEARQEAGVLRCRSSAPERVGAAWLRRYFALDLDLAAILRDIDREPFIHAAIVRYRGLRILRQEPWECLASYILSSFNNIKRIEGMIERLARRCGERVALEAREGHAFPSVEAAAAVPEAELRALGLGFRAPYLRETACRLLASGLDLGALAQRPYPEAKAALLALPGVGEKVADCILLFSQEHWEAFPVDVWVERALRRYFRRRLPARGKLQAFIRRQFGPYAGYAQQYLFHDLRMASRMSRLAPSAREAADARASRARLSRSPVAGHAWRSRGRMV